MGIRKEYRGAAGTLTLAVAIDPDDMSISTTGGTPGWPSGTLYPFVIVIDPGNAGEEKVLCSSRSGNTLTVSQRGYDDTTASSHSIGQQIQHREDADSFTTFSRHIFDTSDDDHLQYVPVDGSRAFTDVDGLVDVPVNVGTVNAEGTSDDLSRADHVHAIGPAAIDDASLFAAGVVDTAALDDDAVTTVKILNAAVTLVKLASGLQPVQVVANAGARPGTPTVGMTIYQLDTGEYLQYHGPTVGWRPPWNSAWGHVDTPKNVVADQGSISSETDVNGCSFTFNSVDNRIYKHTFVGVVSGSVVNNIIIVKICDAADTELARGEARIPVVSGEFTLPFTWIERGLTAASRTRKLRIVASGGASCALHGTSSPTQYSIQDEGSDGLPS